MNSAHTNSLAIQRQRRVRKKLASISNRPRLHVRRSNKHIFAQIIDDSKGVTLVSASDIKLEKAGTKTQMASLVGSEIAQQAKSQRITKVSFDRGAYRFHGRVKALAEAARKAGLEF